MVKASITRVIKTSDEKFDVLVSYVDEEGKKYLIVIPGLIREPKGVSVERREGRLIIRVTDEKGEGFASCIMKEEVFKEGFATLKCPVGRAWVITEEFLRTHRG